MAHADFSLVVPLLENWDLSNAIIPSALLFLMKGPTLHDPSDQRSLNSNQGWAKSPVGRKTLKHNYGSPHNHNDVKCHEENLCFLEHSIQGPISDWCVCWEREEGWEKLSLHRLHFRLEEHTGIGQVKLVVGRVRYTGLTLLHSLYEKGFVIFNLASWLSLMWADWRERDGNGKHHIIAIGHCTDASFF